MRYDTIVVGAGIVGAAVARSLARSGRKVAIVDRSAVASGTSAHGEGNLLVSDKAPGPELELSVAAARLWPQLAAELREELGPLGEVEYEAKGGLVVATTADGANALLSFAATQRAAGVDAQHISSDRAHELEPWLCSDVIAAVWYPADAQIQPTIATSALVASAARAGADVLTGHEVVAAVLDRDGAIRGVRTNRGDISGCQVINCAGPWAGGVATSLGAPIPVRPRRGMVLVTTRMPHRIHRKVYDADYVAAVGSADTALQTSSVVESTAAGTVLIGSSREQIGFRDDFTAHLPAMLARKAIGLFPHLASASVMRSYTGFRPYMPDHLPLIGPDSRVPGLWHATGHEGAGVSLAVSTAELLNDLMDGRSPVLDASAFALERPSLRGEEAA